MKEEGWHYQLVPILCVVAISGAATFSIFAAAPERTEFDAVLGEKVQVEGIAIRDPDRREKTTHLTVEIERIRNVAIDCYNCRVLVYADRFVDVTYGDRVAVTGVLKKPEPFETDNDRTFDYPKYLLAHGVTHTMSFAQVTVLGHGEASRIIGALLSLKHFLLKGIHTALPEPESALLAGLLLGEKQSLGDDITEAFRNAGVIHIIVLSGYNVALVIKVVMYLAQSFLPRVVALTASGVAILAFAIMTGASETTIRASVMAGIVLFAQFLNRPTDGVRILLIAAAGMALWNPYLVLYDLSYQLSILATLGLILFSEPIAKRLPFIPGAFNFREIVATTIGTQLTVLPLLILSVGAVSLVSLFANVLVLPAVAPAMLLGFIAALVAVFSWALAFPISLAAYGVLHYIIAVSVWFGELPFSAIPIPAEWTWPDLVILAAAYAAAFYLYSKRKTVR